MSHLRLGVVGVGALGQHHARILSELDDVTLAGIADTRPSIADEVARRCGCPAFYHHRDLLGRIDAAVIAVPTSFHEPVAAEFLRRRIPVLVEKPLASRLAEAGRVVRLAQQQETLLQVGHVERFNPATGIARPLIDSPRYLRAERCSPFAFRSMDIGVVFDMMIHDIDLVLDWVDAPLVSVEALGMSILGDRDDAVQARLKFADGCVADLTANRVHPSVRRAVQVFCKERVVSVDFHAREVTCFEPTERLRHGPSPVELAAHPAADIDRLKNEIFGSFLKISRPEIPPTDALTAELRHFVHCIRTQEQPLVSGTEALQAVQVATEILQQLSLPQPQVRRQAA